MSEAAMQRLVSGAEDLESELLDARRMTLALVADLSDEQLRVPRLPIVNPLLWELGHIAWFQEHWVLRHRHGAAPVWPDADRLYDSTRIEHDERWRLPLPSRSATLDYMNRVLERVLDRMPTLCGDDAYYARLVLFHEDMHCEALVYTRQTLAYPAPPLAEAPANDAARSLGACSGDVDISGGTFMLGASADMPFVFDNEKWAHPVNVSPFRMARTPVTNKEYVRFVEDKGYERREFWDAEGWAWRQRVEARHPLYWQSRDGGWQQRRFNRFVPLADSAPVCHVTWHEAQAYCRWAGRRLPTEAEWEFAASTEPSRNRANERKRVYPWGDAPPTARTAHVDLHGSDPLPVGALPAGDSAWRVRQMVGNVWEWTASDFAPYPGFTADAYKEYSAPWFGGTHKVLRGGSFATRGRLLCNTYRNFFTPDRCDVPAGFRTCAL
jgi:iron(II)-dependent oxidoreductase